MQPLILVAAAIFLPLLWGWLVYRVMKQCWPASHERIQNQARNRKAPEWVDFQI